MTTERSVRNAEDLDAVRAAVGRLRLSSWSDVERRLLVRAIPSKARRAGLALEVVLSVGGVNTSTLDVAEGLQAVIPLDRLPVDRWATSGQRIWRAAASNTRRLVRPTVTTQRVQSFQVWLLTGDRLTSAVAMDIGYFARAGVADPAQAAFCEASGWWSVLSERAAVILVSDDQTDGSFACELIAGLRQKTALPLPPNLYRYNSARSSFGAAPATGVQRC